jgi:L-threonylcarbamoyladenylate synthase
VAQLHATIIPVDPAQPDPAIIAQMGEAIRAGELVAFPTETVYGLGADATNATAVAGIFAAKGRPSSDPLIVHIAQVAQLPDVTGQSLATLPPGVATLAEAFWPGPLTLVLPRAPKIPDDVTAGRMTVGVRLPAHPVARALIAAARVPIAAPSANRFGHTSPTTAAHVFADLSDRIPWILDGGPSQVGIESTILDMTITPPRLLRPGGVPREAIEATLSMSVVYEERAAQPTDESALAPGMLLSHYAPYARLLLFEDINLAASWQRALDEATARMARGEQAGALAPAAWADRFRAAGVVVAPLGEGADLAAVAQHLFAGLRQLDDAKVSVIVCGSFARTGLGLAVRDRLWRAAGGAVIPANTPLPSEDARKG